MKRAIVTGGMGFIGSHIVDSLIEKGLEVTVIDDMSATENEKFYKNKNAKNVVKDISKDNCEDLFKEVDCVFHLAARSRIQPTIGNPSECFEVNVVGTQRVAERCRKSKVKKLIYSGTSSLYGHQNTVPFMTNMPTDCLNPYSMSKWMGEQVCKLYSQLYDLWSKRAHQGRIRPRCRSFQKASKRRKTYDNSGGWDTEKGLYLYRRRC